MEMKKNLLGDQMILKVEGRLDTTTAPQFEEEMKTSLDGIKKLILDFEELAYISSAGLRVLLSTQKKMSQQGVMVIRNVNDIVMEVFDVTGFADILTIE